MVAARAAEALADSAMGVFEEHGAADLDVREADWRGPGWASGPYQTGYTGHDEDVGFATRGGDAVIRHIPRRHRDDARAGLLDRLEMAAVRREEAPGRTRARVRSYAPPPAGRKEG